MRERTRPFSCCVVHLKGFSPKCGLFNFKFFSLELSNGEFPMSPSFKQVLFNKFLDKYLQ